MFGPAYQEGQNMQWANVGIHLDRDTWSAENIEQREGRLWRQGQTRKVSFYNIDWMFNASAWARSASLWASSANERRRCIRSRSAGRERRRRWQM